MSKNDEILESIKKSNPRFKDMVFTKRPCGLIPYEDFFKEENEIINDIKNTDDLVYANESNKNSK
jgi:hypothetical protein